MISRRTAVGGAISLPLAMIPIQGAFASDDDVEFVEARRVIFAFFEALNASNWSFINAALDSSTNAETNDIAWSPWARSSKDRAVAVRLNDGPMGFLSGSDEVLQFLRFRQMNKGWRWNLPKAIDSIWSPDVGIYCAYSEWQRTDGGSYGHVYPTNPTYFHRFHLSKVEEFGATVSRKINWFQEVSLRNVVYD